MNRQASCRSAAKVFGQKLFLSALNKWDEMLFINQDQTKSPDFPCPAFDELSFENTILIGNLEVELSTDFLFKKKRRLMTKPDRIVYF